jgi:hypothetical protein
MDEVIRNVCLDGVGNEMVQETIAAAGNTEVPAYFTLTGLGYSVDRVDKDGEEYWIAQKGSLKLVADCPLKLLGLSLVRSKRGSRWQAVDNEIDEFLTRFYPSAGRT